MVWNKPQFDSGQCEVLNKEIVYQGFFQMEKYRVRHKLFAGGWSAPIDRELFQRGAAVGIVLYDPVHRLVGLVEQFRIGALTEPAGPWLMEVVAGMIDKGESPEEVARRELIEEAGIEQVIILPICSYLVSPGGTNEKLYLYAGLTDLSSREGGLFGLKEEGEDIRFHIIPVDEAFDALQSDRFNNAATTVSLMWVQLNQQKLVIEYSEMDAS